ncbi:MAG TPA: DMT family transporter [Longimicrobiales bacterium]|nr:DMT family transporter [Longimicrobiales bacterium]
MDRAGQQALLLRSRPVVGAALVLSAASLWATFGIFAKYLYQAGLEPLEVASARAGVAFAAVLLIALARRLRGVRVPLRSMPFFAAYGIAGFALFGLLFLAALQRTTVSIAVALLYTAPAFVVLMSVVLWRERFGRLRMISLGLALTGVMLVTGAAQAVLRGTAALPFPALLFGLGSGLGYALYTLFSKVASERYGPVASVFWSFAFAAASLGILASPVTPFLRAPDQAVLLIGLGIVPTLLPYALYITALKHLRASTAAMLASIEPGIAALLAAVLLGERLEALQMIGMGLVVCAAVLLARQASTTDQRIVSPST